MFGLSPNAQRLVKRVGPLVMLVSFVMHTSMAQAQVGVGATPVDDNSITLDGRMNEPGWANAPSRYDGRGLCLAARRPSI